jgi:RNA polymerase sigma-70 factor (ECF subfamily)
MAYSGLTSCDTKKQIAGTHTCGKAPEHAVPSRDVRMVIPELPRMRRFALLLARHHDWADDLVQESLVRAIRHFDTWEPGTNLRAWLFTIVKNTFLTEVRRRNHHAAPVAIERAHAHGGSPETITELREVLCAFNRLPQRYREILLLVAIEGLTYEEAAGIIGAPLGTVRSRVSRAREAMRKALSTAAGEDASHAVSVRVGNAVKHVSCRVPAGPHISECEADSG